MRDGEPKETEKLPENSLKLDKLPENHDKLTEKGSIITVSKPKVNAKVSVKWGKMSEKVIENYTEVIEKVPSIGL